MEGSERIRIGFGDIWRRTRPEIGARVAAIESAVEALKRDSGNEGEVAAAIVAAHKLAGVLGTFGLDRAGELAQRLETGLESGEGAEELEADAAELARLVAAAEPAPFAPPPDPA